MKRFACLISITALAALAAPAGAEVAVERNTNGSFKALRVGSHPKNGLVLRWDRNGAPKESDLLNSAGDGNGDEAPSAVILPAGKYQTDPMPIVVWPRNTGPDHDIFVSRWYTGSGWTAYEEIFQDNSDEDLDPQIVLDPKGDAHAVWWTSGRVPAIWYSKLVEGSWTKPEQVSIPNRDSRTPIFVMYCNALYINYEDWSMVPIHHECSLKERFDP